MMKLWHLQPKCGLLNTNPAAVHDFVIRAHTERDARIEAHFQAGPEAGSREERMYNRHSRLWLDRERTTCTELTPDGDFGVVVRA
jgi:hypothetical protein